MTNIELEKNQVIQENKEAEIVFQQAMATLEIGKNWLNKNYLADLEQYKVQVFEKESLLKLGVTDVKLFQLGRINLENKQSMLENLTAVYHALGNQGYTVFLWLDCEARVTQLYLGIKKLDGTGEEGGELLKATLNGYFSGSQYKPVSPKETLASLSPNSGYYRSVTSLTTVPSLAVEEREHFMQGLEKFIDAAEKQDYQALFLAEPVPHFLLSEAEKQYANIATQLSSLVKQQISFNSTTSQNISKTISNAITESFTQTETTGTNTAIAIGRTEAHSKTLTQGVAINAGVNVNITATSEVGIPGVVKCSGAVSSGINLGVAVNLNEAINETKTDSVTGTRGQTSNSSMGETNGETKTLALNFGFSESESRTICFETLNKGIERVMQLVDTHLVRINEAKSYGGWQTAAYFITRRSHESQALASIYLGLMRGENSYSEVAALSTWKDDEAKPIFAWLENLTHPRLRSELYVNDITPATLVSGKEMAVQLSLPRRSTSTVTVVEAVPFGRQIQDVDGITVKAEKVVDLGVLRHLWTNLPQKVELDVEKLSSHIFVTGSTGSGKSNTVYQLLDQLNKNDVNFMVIEPAKGEYKNVFGHRDDITVFGTNPQKTTLLRINPFKFPEDVHVLEHIDRLVEIFNVCWPMYAAMPAVLKDAMLESYKISGWDLDTSCNLFGKDNLFPTFTDLLIQLEKVIQQSAFSEEVKSNYIGSLVTRVKSLTNGLNGQIFSANEIDNRLLFDSNVIVDLSRIGAQETKSLIMGILVMRLSEHRISNANGMNLPLKHITVLEEAHNILKRTSTEQNLEGSNVTGKAVEMLSNAIAEMRTYGEGFIIADQSPSAVDISAIRNTNTKIIMRLPDETDRRLAGKASGVTDEQLEEIAKLPKGVAIVYQNDWLEPVLCKIHHFDYEEFQYCYSPKISTENRVDFDLAVIYFLLQKRLLAPQEIKFELIFKGLELYTLPVTVKLPLLRALEQYQNTNKTELWENTNFTLLAKLITAFLDLKKQTADLVFKEAMIQPNDLSSFCYQLNQLITNRLGQLSEEVLLAIEEALLKDFSLETENHLDFYMQWRKYIRG